MSEAKENSEAATLPNHADLSNDILVDKGASQRTFEEGFTQSVQQLQGVDNQLEGGRDIKSLMMAPISQKFRHFLIAALVLVVTIVLLFTGWWITLAWRILSIIDLGGCALLTKDALPPNDLVKSFGWFSLVVFGISTGALLLVLTLFIRYITNVFAGGKNNDSGESSSFARVLKQFINALTSLIKG